MVDDLEYAIDKISGDDLERLLPGFLRHRGYEVKETSPIGQDGGVDAYVALGDEDGIAHASKRKDWRGKLRDDASKVAGLEKDGESVDFLVFLTNRDPNEVQVREMEQEIKSEYGWSLKLFHKTNLIGTLESEHPPKLAEKYLGIDLSSERDHLDGINSLIDNRIDAIRDGQGPASNLQQGPLAILHLVPNGVFAGKYTDRVDNLPTPPIYGMLATGMAPDVTGDGKYVTKHRGGVEYPSYTYLRTDGLFEAVGTKRFIEHGSDKGIRNDSRTRNGMLDLDFVINAKSGLNRLLDMGVSGPVYAKITLLGIGGYKMTMNQRRSPFASNPSFNRDMYQTNLTDGDATMGEYNKNGNRIKIEADDPVFSMLEPLITQYWQEAGRREGSPHYNDNREWVGPPFATRL